MIMLTGHLELTNHIVAYGSVTLAIMRQSSGNVILSITPGVMMKQGGDFSLPTLLR
jgi:hypothetical protein